MTKEAIKARMIVLKIIQDLQSRRGIGQSWDEIRPGIQQEIIDHWENIALSVIREESWPFRMEKS